MSLADIPALKQRVREVIDDGRKALARELGITVGPGDAAAAAVPDDDGSD